MDLRFDDHASFHRAAAGMVAGSTLLGLALHPLTPLAPLIGGTFGLAIGAVAGYGRPVIRLAAATIATVPLLAMRPTWPVLAAGAAVLGIGLAIGGVRGKRGALVAMFGATIALVAMWAASKVYNAEQTHGWSAWTRDLAASAAMGIVGVIAMLPRHLRASIDPVHTALRGLPRHLDPEVRGLCDRSVAIWNDAKQKIAPSDPGMNLVRDGVLKTIEVAGKSVRVDSAGPSENDLAKRAADLDARIAAATDDEVRTQYQQARSALEDQRRYRERIAQSRERVVARLHNHVAALEKFQLAASGLEASRVANESAPAAKQLDELSAEVAASGEALAEVA